MGRVRPQDVNLYYKLEVLHHTLCHIVELGPRLHCSAKYKMKFHYLRSLVIHCELISSTIFSLDIKIGPWCRLIII